MRKVKSKCLEMDEKLCKCVKIRYVRKGKQVMENKMGKREK